jgi:hypothetical protein
VDEAFGTEIDYGMLVKIYGASPESMIGRYSPAVCIGAYKSKMTGKPDEFYISTSYVERQNLNMRMGMRRFTQLTNAFSKKLENHYHALSLYFVFYNFVRMHKTLRMSPAMAAGVTDKLMSMEDIAALVDAVNPVPASAGLTKRGLPSRMAASRQRSPFLHGSRAKSGRAVAPARAGSSCLWARSRMSGPNT